MQRAFHQPFGVTGDQVNGEEESDTQQPSAEEMIKELEGDPITCVKQPYFKIDTSPLLSYCQASESDPRGPTTSRRQRDRGGALLSGPRGYFTTPAERSHYFMS